MSIVTTHTHILVFLYGSVIKKIFHAACIMQGRVDKFSKNLGTNTEFLASEG